MALIPDPAAFKKSLASLPVKTFKPGEAVLTAGSTTGQLFILKEGVVDILRDGVKIATVSEPGAVFGELAVLLDKPHTADVLALETSEFHVAQASSLLGGDPTTLLYITTMLARRLDSANTLILEIKRELDPSKRPGVITRALDRLEELFIPKGAEISLSGHNQFF